MIDKIYFYVKAHTLEISSASGFYVASVQAVDKAFNLSSIAVVAKDITIIIALLTVLMTFIIKFISLPEDIYNEFMKFYAFYTKIKSKFKK